MEEPFKGIGRDFFVNLFGFMVMDGKDKTVFKARMTKLFMTSLGGHEGEIKPKENSFYNCVRSRLWIFKKSFKFFAELIHRQ